MPDARVPVTAAAPRATRAVRVLLADREGVARRAVAAVIEDIGDATLVGEVDSTHQIPAALRRLQPDVLVIDDRLLNDDEQPLAAGGALAGKLRMLVVGIDTNPAFAARALRLGAHAWIPKEFADEALRELVPA